MRPKFNEFPNVGEIFQPTSDYLGSLWANVSYSKRSPVPRNGSQKIVESTHHIHINQLKKKTFFLQSRRYSKRLAVTRKCSNIFCVRQIQAWKLEIVPIISLKAFSNISPVECAVNI